VRLNGERFAGVPRPLAARLKDAGYQTGAVVGAFVLDRRFGLDAGFDSYDDRIERDPNAVDRLDAERRAAQVIDAAIGWLERTDRSRPWMLWAHLYDPHAPYDPPTSAPSSSASETATERAYDGEVAYADRELARLLAAVDRLGVAASTAILVSGDHGESLGEHGEPTHGMLVFDAALRVPIIVCAPSVAPREQHGAVSIIDIAPTAMALAGLARDEMLDGRSLLDEPSADREIYAETEYPTAAGWLPTRALIRDRWKAIGSAGTVLFDLARDPGEASDLASTRAPLATAMRGRIDAMATSATPPADTTRVAGDTAERLRALGYVSPAPRPAIADRRGIDPATVIEQWATFERALTEMNAHDVKNALPRLRALASSNRDAPLFQSMYARALAESGQRPEALAIYRTAVGKWPGDAMLYHELATVARDVGRHDEARRAEQAALTIDPALAVAHNGLGLLHADRGELAEASRAFGEARQLDPTNASYLTNLGNAQRGLNDLAAAELSYRAALDRAPGFADAANGLGVVLVQQHRAADAVPWLERAVAAEPGFVEARLNLGIALQESGDRTRAAEQYRAVLAAPGDHPRERAAARMLLAQLTQR
jgi:choline-sulfatase